MKKTIQAVKGQKALMKHLVSHRYAIIFLYNFIQSFIFEKINRNLSKISLTLNCLPCQIRYVWLKFGFKIKKG